MPKRFFCCQKSLSVHKAFFWVSPYFILIKADLLQLLTYCGILPVLLYYLAFDMNLPIMAKYKQKMPLPLAQCVKIELLNKNRGIYIIMKPNADLNANNAKTNSHKITNSQALRAFTYKLSNGNPIGQALLWHFPWLAMGIRSLSDSRRPGGRLEYPASFAVMQCISAFMMQTPALSAIAEDFNTDEAVGNIYGLLGLEPKSLKMPTPNALGDIFAALCPDEMEALSVKCSMQLFREHRDGGRKRPRVFIDGTGLHSYGRACPYEGCPFKTYNKGKENEYNFYLGYVVEVKIMAEKGALLSIATEFLYDTEGEAHDCEKAAAPKALKKAHKALGGIICDLYADALYLNSTVLSLLEQWRWGFFIAFKDGAETIREPFDEGKAFAVMVDGERRMYMNGIDFAGFEVNAARSITVSGDAEAGTETAHEFAYITHAEASAENFGSEIISEGRIRQSIEDSFNTQKNRGFDIEHILRRGRNAMRSFYYAQQISHAVFQAVLLDLGKPQGGSSARHISFAMKAAFVMKALPAPRNSAPFQASQGQLAIAAPPSRLALSPPAKTLAIAAPPKRLALAAPEGVLAIAAPPKRVAAAAPFMKPAGKALRRKPAARQAMQQDSSQPSQRPPLKPCMHAFLPMALQCGLAPLSFRQNGLAHGQFVRGPPSAVWGLAVCSNRKARKEDFL